MTTGTTIAEPNAAIQAEAQVTPIASGGANQTDALPKLREFILALRRGDTQAALAAARDACLAEPNRAEAHYAYGQAWMAARNPARAEQSFAMAARLRPGFADAWVNYGLARYAQGAVYEAKEAMVRARQAQPDHAAATTNLAVLLHLIGGYDAADTLLREALARNPNDAGARLNLVAARLHDGQHAEALALLNEVDAPAGNLPAARNWHLQRAQALIGLDRPDKARTALDEFGALGPAPPELLPLRLWCDVVLALAEGRRADAYASAQEMEATLENMGPAAVLEHKIMAHYDLAKFWSSQGDDSKAFAQWCVGHALLRQIQPFSRQATRAYNDTAIATFTPQRYADGPRAGNSDTTPVFIVGMPRSGTTLAEQILAAHGQAHGAGERTALGRLAWRLGAPDTAEFDRPHRRARSGHARPGGRDLSEGIARAGAGQDPHRRQDAGKLSLCLADRAAVPEGENYSLRARSARHRLIDLHLPLSRRARLCPRSRRSRLDDRRAGQTDEALEGRAAAAGADASARRLGARISTRRSPAYSTLSICRRTRPARAFTSSTAGSAR